MLDDLLDHGVNAIQWDLRVTIAVTILSVFAGTFILTSLQSNSALYGASGKKDAVRTPPIMPYAIPVAGNLFAFAFDTRAFIGKIVKTYGSKIPIRIKVLDRKLNYISGAENVLAMFRGSRDLSTAPASILVLENAFGSPAESRHVFQQDNTGFLDKPLEGSNPVEQHNRIFHYTHKSLHFHLTGTVGLNELATQFMRHLEIKLDALDIGEEWTDIPDLYALIQKTVFEASTTALCGPTLLRLNPELTTEFWTFDDHMPNLFKGVPRFLVPAAYSCRDRMKSYIMKWHAYVAEHFDEDNEELQKTDWEELYGTRLMRERQAAYRNIDDYGAEARAANDLGMIWGTNGNIVPIIGWTLLDTLIRPEVLAQSRDIINNSMDSSFGKSALSMSKLCASPLLQSIYSEELRVRTGLFIQRVPIVSNFKIGSWLFPKGEMIVASSWHEHRNTNVWNEGPVKGEFHSVEDFWAERFLVFPDDPSSGPAKPTKDAKSKPPTGDTETQPKYTNESVTGSYIPYGGGQKICPGRFYAKQEAIGAMAMFLLKFDIELMSNEQPQPNHKYFAFGVIPPLGKFPARMRRRKA